MGLEKSDSILRSQNHNTFIPMRSYQNGLNVGIASANFETVEYFSVPVISIKILWDIKCANVNSTY